MKISSYALSFLLLTGCASTPMTGNATDTTTTNVAGDAAAAIAAADAARAQAAKIGHEWRDTEKLIKDAQAALDKGDQATALKLANQAQAQGEAAYQQGITQQQNGYHMPF